jgi:hypothetical protein
MDRVAAVNCFLLCRNFVLFLKLASGCRYMNVTLNNIARENGVVNN